MDNSPIGMDATGYEVMTAAMKWLLNQYPGLSEDENITYENLEEKTGIAFSADNGALIYTEREDVIGNIHQTCQYPFYVVYRSEAVREKQKINIQTFLDNLGKWLCGETVTIDDKDIRLTEYPSLTKGREIKRITRDNSYALEPQENGVQDWLLPISVRYENEIEAI